MSLNPVAEGEVFVGCQDQDTYVDVVNFFLEAFCVFVDDLPSKAKSNQKSNDCYPWKCLHDVSYHFTHDAADAILRILVVMITLQRKVDHHHVQRAKCKVERAILLFKSLLILLIFVMVQPRNYNEDDQEQKLKDAQVIFVFAEVAACIVDCEMHFNS